MEVGKIQTLSPCVHRSSNSSLDMSLAPSMYLFMQIKVDKQDYLKISLHNFKSFLILGSFKFLAYLECIRSQDWSFDHSEPDLRYRYSSFRRPCMYYVTDRQTIWKKSAAFFLKRKRLVFLLILTLFTLSHTSTMLVFHKFLFS